MNAPLAIPKDKEARLAAFLGSLPEATAARLFGVLEHDRSRGGAGLPHDALLGALRARLLTKDVAFPQRAPTAQRLFFTPFEDFFTPLRAGRKRAARIARPSLAPIWKLLNEDPACEGARRAASALDRALRDGSANVAAFETTLFAEAREGLARLASHARADEAFRADLAERLGGKGALDDMEELALLLPAAGYLKKLQAAFPKPVAAITEEELFEARRLYNAARAEAPDAAPYLLLALIGRMETPWRALALHYHFAAAGEAGGETGVIRETLFEDLETAALSLERDAEADLDSDEAALRVAHFADFAEGLAGEARRAGDAVAQNRIEACRDIAGETLARFTERSLAALRRAMPVRHAGGSSRLLALRPDYARALPAALVETARDAARFLAGAARLAQRLGRAPVAGGVVEDAVGESRRYLGDLVVEIRAAEAEDRVAARRLMEQAIAVAEPLLPPDEISLLRQRALAAAHSA